MKWVKDNVGKTLGDAIIEWKQINDLKKDQNYLSEIDSQFEYNVFGLGEGGDFHHKC